MRTADKPAHFRSFAKLDTWLEEQLAQKQAALRRVEEDRECLDCGGPRNQGCQRCAKCASKRKSKLARDRQRRHRKNCREQVSRFCGFGPLSTKDLQQRFPAGRARGPRGDSGTQKRDKQAVERAEPKP